MKRKGGVKMQAVLRKPTKPPVTIESLHTQSLEQRYGARLSIAQQAHDEISQLTREVVDDLFGTILGSGQKKTKSGRR